MNNKKQAFKLAITALLLVILICTPFLVKTISYINAVHFFEEEKYENAITEFERLGEYKDSLDYLFESKYNLARQYLSNGKSREALQIFDEIKEQKDSKKYSDYILELNYFTAQAFLDEGEYDLALKIFEEVEDSIDVKEDIQKANYLKAVELYEEQNYEEAMKIFSGMDKSYKDVEDYIKKYPSQKFVGNWVFSNEDYIFRAYSFSVVGAKITEDEITFLTREEDYIADKYKIDGDILTPVYENGKESETSIQYISANHLIYRTKGYNGNIIEYDMKRGEVNKREEPYIGMSAADLLDSTWGVPKDINKTTTAYGVHEQWCYNGYRYVYLDNGIVTGIQE